MVILVLFLLFVVWPVAEIVAIVAVADLVGIPLMLGLLFLGSAAGALVFRYSGRTAWRRFRDAVRAGRTPTREVVDGTLVVSAGVLLLIPGFVTGVLGLVCLFPPTRAIIRRIVIFFGTSNIVVRVGTTAYGGGSAAWRRVGGSRSGARPGAGGSVGGSPPAYDVEGTAVEVDQRRLES